MAPPRVRIVLPAYDESRTLARSVHRLVDFCQRRISGYRWSLLIAENGSRDGTAELADALAAADPHIDVLHRAAAGRGGALRSAAALGGADYVLYSDVDLSAELEAIPHLLAALDGGADLAVGSRLHPRARVQRGARREVLSRGYNLLLRAALGVGFGDAQCGLKAWHRVRLQPLIDRIRDDNWFFDTELLVLAEMAGHPIVEVPVDWVEDTDSRVRIAPTVAEKLRGVIRLRRTARHTAAALRKARDRLAAVASRPPAALADGTAADSDGLDPDAAEDSTAVVQPTPLTCRTLRQPPAG